MKARTPIVILLIMLVSLSVMASANVQAQAQAKGGSDAQLSALDQKAPKIKPSPTIATGVVSELPAGAEKYAIVIGISDYAGDVNDLDYCDDDAREFSSALVANGWDVTLLIDGDATRENILDAISDVRAAEDSADDQVVFFYSGHGTVGTNADSDSERKDECIIPYECTLDAIIWDGDLAAEFSTFDSKRIMFYFDSCYSGGMTDLAGAGRLVLMACGENQLSLESSSWENGQFTYYFVDQGMLKGLADKNGDSRVTFEEAFDYAKAHCSRQTPVASDGFTNDMPY